jgi:uncharacterized membrane protein
MAKHTRFSDKPKPDFSEKEEKTQLEETPSFTNDISLSNSNNKSFFQSVIKYVYLITVIALFSGIFTPLTLGVEIEEVIFAMLTISLGLVGGIVIFLGVKYQKYTIITVCGGSGLMIVALILMQEVTGHGLFL